MSVFGQNLALLQKRFPVAAERVGASSVSVRDEPAELTVEETQWVVSRWLDGLAWDTGSLLAVSGWGNGTHIRKLLRSVGREVWVFVAEPDAGVLRASLESEDWSGELEDDRLLVGTGALDDEFFAALEVLDILKVRHVEPLVFAPCYNRDPEYHARFFTEFTRQVDFRRKLYGTAVVDAELWLGNSFDNLRNVVCAPDVGVLRDAFQGWPMVLVSAGPSLDESLDFIREVEGRAIIVAVNSSYRALRHAGVVPHLVLAADPREHTVLGFNGVPTDRTWLVTTPIVAPEVPRLFEGRVIGWSGNNHLATILRRRCGLPPGTALIEQGTVSACAVDLAVVLGCDRLCLVGQDLAVSADGRSHADDSFYTDLEVNHVDLMACRYLPGNTVDKVPVEEKLYVYLKTFEALAASRSGLRMINTARLGARIPGVPYASFRDASTWIGRESRGDVFVEIERRCSGATAGRLDYESALASLASTREYAGVLVAQALRLVSHLEASFAGPEPDAALREAPEYDFRVMAEALRKALESQPEEFSILESGRFRLENHRLNELLVRLASETDPSERALREAREFAWTVAEGAWFLCAKFDELHVVGGIGEILHR